MESHFFSFNEHEATALDRTPRQDQDLSDDTQLIHFDPFQAASTALDQYLADGPGLHDPQSAPWSVWNTDVTVPVPSAPQSKEHSDVLPDSAPSPFTEAFPTFDFRVYRDLQALSETETVPGTSSFIPPAFSAPSVASYQNGDPTLETELQTSIKTIDIRRKSSPQNEKLCPTRTDLVCTICDASAKNQSDLRKHVLRHSKPFLCIHGCTGQGFPTPNDLYRHLSSVHRDYRFSNGVYVCFHCRPKEKVKIWPRADNFRSHLTRVHNIKPPNGNVERYKRSPDRISLPNPSHAAVATNESPTTSSPLVARPASVNHDLEKESLHSERAIGDLDARSNGFYMDVNLLGPEPHNFLDTFPEPEAVQLGDFQGEVLMDLRLAPNDVPAGTPFIFDDGSSQAVHQESAGANVSRPQTLARAERNDFTNEAPILLGRDVPREATGHFISSLTDIDLLGSLDPTNDNNDELDGRTDESSSLPPIRHPDVLALLRQVPREMLQTELRARDAADGDAATPCTPNQPTSARHSCHACNKSFARASELRKHLKRHDKPYGCTQYRCNKAFGSKNDWKRHENTQHPPGEVWFCDVDHCHEVCHQRLDFARHLQDQHGLQDQDGAEFQNKMRDCCRSPSDDDSFWCGFCTAYVMPEDGIDSRTYRFDHIDNHLFGKQGCPQKQSHEWVYMEDLLPNTPGLFEQQPQPQGSRATPVDGDLVIASDAIDEKHSHHRPQPDPSPLYALHGETSQVQTTISRADAEDCMWQCCHCPRSCMLRRNSSACIECNHRMCVDCTVDFCIPTERQSWSTAS